MTDPPSSIFIFPMEMKEDSFIVTFLAVTLILLDAGRIFVKKQPITRNSPEKPPVIPPPIVEASGFQFLGYSPFVNSESFTNPVSVIFWIVNVPLPDPPMVKCR